MSDEKFEIICDSNENPEEWLKLRNLAVGASDSPCLFGEHPNWMSPTKLVAIKGGAMPEWSGNEISEAGKRIEPFTAEWTLEEMHKRGRSYGLLIRSKQYEWMQCTPDWMVSEMGDDPLIPDGWKGTVPFEVPLQIKNTMISEAWKDGVPNAVMIQCQHELIVTGAPWGYVACLLTGNRLRWTIIRPDEELQQQIIEKTGDWWDAFINGREMEVDGSDATRQALAAMHPDDNGLTVTLSGELMEKARLLDEMKEGRKEFTKQISILENTLRAVIGGNTYGTFPDGSGFSLKTTNRHDPPREAKDITFRTLRRQQAKL